MGETTQNKGKLGRKQIIIIAAIAVVVILGILLFLFNKGIRATTMRLLRMEGTVNMEEDGKPKQVKENLRLKSGNALSTELASLVSIGLDDTKIVTLDEESRAEFTQAGKDLDLNLTAGKLFFEVDKPLETDETMEIRTSTMVVGIRGTSGVVSVDGEHEQVLTTDGIVHIVGTNPTTGEVKEIDVPAGKMIKVYLYNDRTVDSIMFELVDATEADLPPFVIDRLRENEDLLNKVIADTNWSKPIILGIEEVKSEEPEVDSEPAGEPEVNNTPAPEEEKEEPVEEPEEEEGDGDEDEDDEPTPEEILEETEEIKEAEIEKALEQVLVDHGDGTYDLKDGSDFDANYYAANNPDVVAAYGNDSDALLAHYLNHGKEEGRSADATEDHIKAAKKVEAAIEAEQAAKKAQEEAAAEANNSSGNDSGSSTGIALAQSVVAAINSGNSARYGGYDIGRDGEGIVIYGFNNGDPYITDLTAHDGYITFTAQDTGDSWTLYENGNSVNHGH